MTISENMGGFAITPEMWEVCQRIADEGILVRVKLDGKIFNLSVLKVRIDDVTTTPIDFAANDPVQVLESLASTGWAVSIGHYMDVWTCAIGPRTIGSITWGMFDDTVTGMHATSMILAIQDALTAFKVKHLEVFV